MTNKLPYFLTVVILLLISTINFAQVADLGVASEYILFSSDGAVTNTGISQITGNVGTNNGSSTGFGNVNGVMHDGDISSVQCASDLLVAYNQLNDLIPDFFPAPLLGGGQILFAGIYQITEAATLDLELILDAQNDANAEFVFQIQGSFSTFANAKVKLINGAQACNVFWKVEGLIDMASGTTMRGTLIANNAGINLSTGDTLEGRAFTTTGAINLDGVFAYTPIGCGSPTLLGPAAPNLGEAECYGLFSSEGPVQNSGITNIIGDVGANVGLTTGFDPLLVSGNIHAIPDASTAQTASDLLIAYNYLNMIAHDIELLYPAQFGGNLVLTPHTYIMNGATTFTDLLYLNALGNSEAVFILKLNGALTTSTYAHVILMNEALAKNVYWLVNGAVEINDYSVFNGTIVSQGAINLYTGVTLNGRALTGVGALTSSAITGAADIQSDCVTTSGILSPDVINSSEIVSVYPNPFSNSLSINLKDMTKNNKYDLKIYNTLGMTMLNVNLTQQSTILETKNLPSGIYFYKVIVNDNIIQTGRIISIQN
jgi:hypothetical protein